MPIGELSYCFAKRRRGDLGRLFTAVRKLYRLCDPIGPIFYVI